MKQLEEKFNGRGEVKGYVFEQLERSPFAYGFEYEIIESKIHEI